MPCMAKRYRSVSARQTNAYSYTKTNTPSNAHNDSQTSNDSNGSAYAFTVKTLQYNRTDVGYASVSTSVELGLPFKGMLPTKIT